LETAVTQRKAQTVKPVEEPAQAKPATRAKTPAKLEVVKPAESAQVSEWVSSKGIQAWARIVPEIGALDLRPYLFVAKDRKDYFGATSVLGHLASVAEKLLGPKFSVISMEEELSRLALPEAAQVFEAVRGRIIGGDTFETEPSGAAGLSVLVKMHPSLQGDLLDFLGALPRARLGPWVCNGWEGVIKDPEMIRRFDTLLESWSKEGGQFLKGVAIAALRTRRPGVR
jgi:hypothetical protein